MAATATDQFSPVDGPVRSRWAQEWNRAYLLTCGAGLIVDPLFLYTLSISRPMMCLFVDGWFAITVTVLRCMIDVLHVWNAWMKVRTGCYGSGTKEEEEEVVAAKVEEGRSKRPRRTADGYKYLKSNKGLLLDFFVLLPVMQVGIQQQMESCCVGFPCDRKIEMKPCPLEETIETEKQKIGRDASSQRSPLHLRYIRLQQRDRSDSVTKVALWVAAPALIREGSTTTVMTVFLIMFLFQYLPKIYHSVRFLRRMHNVSAYIFGTIWWGIALNLIAYFVASHAVGACWYLLGIQRAAKCLKEQCMMQAPTGCTVKATACVSPIYYGATTRITDGGRMMWTQNVVAGSTCLDSSDKFQYGAYKWTVPLVTNTNRLEKMLLPIFWGLMTLSTFGNLESTTEWLEIVFNIIIITGGLILVTMLIGNIKVFLNATTSKKQSLHLRMRSMDWWMKKNRLPQGFRQRVRQYERQRWAAMRGVDECEMVRNLPEGLRRDIKYHLCLDLVRQVPLFQHMDELVLENICDRVKSLIFPKGEMITREGDPVQRMIFVVRGHLQSSQVLRDGVSSYCMLGPGNFSGDELLSWCLRRPFVERLPLSSSTLITLEATEAFGLEASDVKYVTQHFRYTFVNEKVRRSARYYSPGWRTWAAVAIQLTWRRYRHRKTLTSLSFIRPRRPLSRCSSLGEEKLRLYTALLTSPKPDADEFLL